MNKHNVVIDETQCIGCGLCANTCVAHNIEIKNQKAEILLKDCLMCGQCLAVCPKNAITITNYLDKPRIRQSDERLNPQLILDTIRFRRSIRQFQDKQIPKQVLEQILEAGRLTHTAKNMQDVSFIVLDKQKDEFEQIAVRLFRKIKPFAGIFNAMTRHREIDDHFFFFKAPIAIVVLAKDKENGLLAAQNMEFVAEANGLGVLFSGFFSMAANHSRKMKKALQIPRKKRVAMTLVIGYPAIKFQRSPQREELDVNYR